MFKDLLNRIEKGHVRKAEALLKSNTPPLSQNELNAALCMAALWQRLNLVKRLLEMGADVNCRYNENWRPLHYAARGRNLEIITYLLDRGAEINPLNDYGRTPLIEAAVRGEVDIITELISRGADIHHHAKVGGTAVAEAAWNNRPGAVEALIRAGADQNAAIRDNFTLLDWATRNGHGGVVDLLLPGRDSMDNRETVRVLINAVWKGDTRILKQILDSGANVNGRDKDGFTPLMHAASRSMTSVSLLLENGADTQSTNDRGQSALSEAANAGRQDIAELLIQNGAPIQPARPGQVSPLGAACVSGHRETAAYILNHHDTDINYVNGLYDGATALMIVSRNGHDPIVKILLNKRADHTPVDGRGLTAFHYAALNGNIQSIRALHAAGSDINVPSGSGYTPLMLAVSDFMSINKHGTLVESAAWLAENSADINQRAESGQTALMIAVNSAGAAMVKLLLDQGAEPDAPDSNSDTALCMAARVGVYDDRYSRPKNRKQDSMADIIDLLLAAGADPDRNMLLLNAVRYRSYDVVKKLLEAGAKVNIVSKTGITPLMCASGSAKITRLLIRYKSDAKAADNSGRTPLHWIAGTYADNGPVARVLVNAGADVNAEDNNGRTPLHEASRTNRADTVESLIELGADIHAADSSGKTALDLARESGQTYVVKVLEKYD